MSKYDGSVSINIIADETQALKLLKSLQGIDTQVSQMNRSMGSVNTKPLDNMAQGAKKAETNTTGLFKAFLGSHIVVGAMNLIKDSVGQAISRFDTMKQYPKMMEQLGFSSSDSERSIRKLARGIEGLPTRLDEVVATTQKIATITGDINYATDLTLALNNAFLSSGSSSEDAARGLQQYTQMLSSGKVDMQSWKTLQETMGVGLKKVATEMGYVGTNAVPQLYAALKGGEITFRDFSMKLIEMDKATGGFAETAQIGSQGIATSWQNVKTAVVNGIANIIDVFDSNQQKMTGAGIAAGLDILKMAVKAAFENIKASIEFVLPIFNFFINIIKTLIKVGGQIKPVLDGLAAGFAVLMIVQKINTLFAAQTGVLAVLKVQSLAAAASIETLGVAQGIAAIVSAGFGAMTTAVKGFFAGIGPIGWAIAGITALAIGIKAAVGGMSEETEKLLSDVDAAKEATSLLNDSVAEGKGNWESNREYMQANHDAMEMLIGKTQELADSQNRGAAGTKELKDNIAELNKYYGEEVIMYDAKTKGINQNTESMQLYLEAASAEKDLIATKEEIARLDKEKIDLDTQRKVNTELLTKAEQELNDLGDFQLIQKKKVKDKIEELKDADNELAAAQKVNAEQHVVLEGQKQEAMKQSGEAHANLQERIKQTGVTYDDLDKTEQKMVDNMQKRYKAIEEASTEMFDKISTKSKLSKEEMLKNLRHNVEATEQWADNIGKLADRGINEGMLEKLRNMGPEGAGYVKELATMSDSELKEFNKLFDKAGKEAPEALADSLGTKGKESIPKGVMDIVTATETTLTSDFVNNDWSKYGEAVPEGISKGVEKGSKDTENKTKAMGKKMEDAFKAQLGINSPSRVFTAFGKNVAEGLANGLQEGTKLIARAMEMLSKNLTKVSDQDFKRFTDKAKIQFKTFAVDLGDGLKKANTFASQGLDMLSRMFKSRLSDLNRTTDGSMNVLKRTMNITTVLTRLGRYAGDGFASGLLSRSSYIIGIAKSIANAVAYTIRKALRIQSPSKVLAELGRYTGEGFEVGLDKKIESIKDKAKELAESAIPKIDKKRLFAASKELMVNKQITNNHVNNEQKSEVTNENGVNIENINVEWKGKEDIRKTMQEIGWIAGRDNWRLQPT